LRNDERCLNGNKVYKLYKDCPIPDLKPFLRAYARSLNGPEVLEGYARHHRYHYRYYNHGIKPTVEYLADTAEPHPGYTESHMPEKFHPLKIYNRY